MNCIKKLFLIEKKPVRGLLAIEWLVLAYMALTLLVMMFTYTKVVNPDSMVWGRLRIAAAMLALWVVYRLVPCRLTLAARVVTQMAMLAWWYPDTYELNRVFPNLDHVFAAVEHALFGFQPALVFAASWPSRVVSELMSLGYASYYPMIALVVFYYFFRRYEEFHRCAFIIMAAFLIYYVIFVFVPVTGPTFYYKAVGIDNIASGVFPDVHDYFNHHQDCPLRDMPMVFSTIWWKGPRLPASGLRRRFPAHMSVLPPCLCCWLFMAAAAAFCIYCCRFMCCCACPPSTYRRTMP